METPWALLGTPWDPFGISEDPIWHLWELFGSSLGPLEGPWASTRDSLKSFLRFYSVFGSRVDVGSVLEDVLHFIFQKGDLEGQC